MKTNYLFQLILLTLILGLAACDKEATPDDEQDPACINLSDTLPIASSDHEFYIGALVDGQPVIYPQYNFINVHPSNHYLADSRQTWLGADDTASNSRGIWRLRVTNLNIDSIPKPFVLEYGQGHISWLDKHVDDIYANDSRCGPIDADCIFSLTPSAINKITIHSVNDSIIQGVFEGKAHLFGTGFYPFIDESVTHDFCDGRFKIKFRRD